MPEEGSRRWAPGKHAGRPRQGRRFESTIRRRYTLGGEGRKSSLFCLGALPYLCSRGPDRLQHPGRRNEQLRCFRFDTARTRRRGTATFSDELRGIERIRSGRPSPDARQSESQRCRRDRGNQKARCQLCLSMGSRCWCTCVSGDRPGLSEFGFGIRGCSAACQRRDEPCQCSPLCSQGVRMPLQPGRSTRRHDSSQACVHKVLGAGTSRSCTAQISKAMSAVRLRKHSNNQ